jgi:hypothetical protein
MSWKNIENSTEMKSVMNYISYPRTPKLKSIKISEQRGGRMAIFEEIIAPNILSLK